MRDTKIAMLGTLPPLRGLSSYCLEMAGALAALVGVEFISFKRLYPKFLYPGGDLKEDHTFPALDIQTLNVRRQLTWYNPLTWGKEAFSTRAELLHAQWWSLPLALVYFCMCATFKLRGKPVVFTVHNVLNHDRSRIYLAVSKLLFKLGNHFIVHTEKNRQQLTDHYGISEDAISVIPHGSLDFHVRPQIDAKKLREDFGLAPDQKVVLLFGAIRPYKGISTAIESFPAVIEKIPEAVLLIAGKLWENWTPYQNLINRLGIGNSVKAHGEYIPSGEVYKYFEASDLVILPYEQFDSQSGVGSTAVSFRKPMIVTDVGGLSDLVPNDRWIVPPGDAEALSRAMIDCLKNPALLKEMTAGAEEIAAKLSWSAIARQTVAVYERLLINSIVN